MNKTKFIDELSRRTSMEINDCNKINEILENYFFISRKNKDKITNELINFLNISEDKAIEIYNTSKEIINSEIKNKFKHPFKSKD